ncbi:SDR family oxidoreductase [Nocardia sp. CA-128927]|uniref:SDR family oxidoreductase n=1 Tax=Nocardia sp. CA-128927 TaxID=3239975 RepID=UPI003D96026E
MSQVGVDTTAKGSGAPSDAEDLRSRTVVLIGGGSGIGLRVAHRVVAAGGRVVLGGRTASRLAAAATELGDAASWQASYEVGPMRELSDAAAASPFESKFWGQYHAVPLAAPKLAEDGSAVLMSGAASARPAGLAPAYVACNAAIEGLGRGLAVELAPVRVNVISPGTVDGHLWSNRPDTARTAAFDQYRRETLLGRPATEDEIAHSVVYLFTNTFTTGSTLYPDGGYTLR